MLQVQSGEWYSEAHKVFGSLWCPSVWASHEQQGPGPVKMRVQTAILSKFYCKFCILQLQFG